MMSCSNPHKRIKLDTALQFAIRFLSFIYAFFLLEISVFLCLVFICENFCIFLSAEIKLVSLKLVSLTSPYDSIAGVTSIHESIARITSAHYSISGKLKHPLLSLFRYFEKKTISHRQELKK